MNTRRFPSSRISNRKSPRRLIVAASIVLLSALALAVWWWLRPHPPLAAVVTLATLSGAERPVKTHQEPFGLAADDDGNLFISESTRGRIYRLAAESYAAGATAQLEVIAENLATPSAIARDANGNLLVANTGAHTIVRVDVTSKRVTVIAGQPGASGDADGASNQARFNAPIGLAVAADGAIYVADTYNDRIRHIAPDGGVRTLAGASAPGFADGTGAAARFDTPCGLAIATDGTLLVADTGNHRIRRVTMDGVVTTIAGTGEPRRHDGAPLAAAFSEPMAIAVRDKQSFYVADAAYPGVRLCEWGEQPAVKTLASDFPSGLLDDQLGQARFNRPTGLALLPDGALALADSESGLVRALVSAQAGLGFRANAEAVVVQAEAMRLLVEPRWPFDPPQTRREIAGTFGEVRGERLPEHDAWFHNGLDVPGAYGETVRAVLTEPVTRPFAVEGVGNPRERVRLPLFGYIHLRVGRDQHDKLFEAFNNGAITFRRDEQGQITDLRLRRGTLIKAGAPLGTLNRLNHVHLIAGPPSFEFNALAALRLPGLIDTVPPVIEAVTLTDELGAPIFATEKSQSKVERIHVRGKLRIIVRAYDQADGNASYRRLGAYRLGYQLLDARGAPLPQQALNYNLLFDRLPADWNNVALAYAEGSQSGYQGRTIFDYAVTNVVRGGQARADFCDVTTLAAGHYTLRVVVEDFFGNGARRDLPLIIESPPRP